MCGIPYRYDQLDIVEFARPITFGGVTFISQRVQLENHDWVILRSEPSLIWIAVLCACLVSITLSYYGWNYFLHGKCVGSYELRQLLHKVNAIYLNQGKGKIGAKLIFPVAHSCGVQSQVQ